MYLFWHLFAIIFTRTSLFFHLLMFQGHESLADHLWRSYLTFLGSSDGSQTSHLFCHVIQSQAALTCASCARSLGSGNRCPGVFGSGILVLLLPSCSSLFSMVRKLINFKSCIILLIAFLGICQVLASRSPLRKSLALPLILLLIFMEFLSSSFLPEVSFKRIFTGRVLEDIFILHNCL